MKTWTNTFSRMHYEKIAVAIGKAVRSEAHAAGVSAVVGELCIMFKQDNPRFIDKLFAQKVKENINVK